MLLLQRCSHLTSLHLLTSNFSPSSSSTSSSSSSPCLHFAPSLDLPPSHNHSLSTIHLPLTIIPLLSRLSHLSLSLKTIPPSLLPSVPSLKSLTLHVSDPACTVTCSSAPFSHLSLLSHLELQMGSDWAKAYPVPRLYENMFSGLKTLSPPSLSPSLLWHTFHFRYGELSALRSLSIRNPAFQPGVQRHAYEAGVSGLRHLSCLQLLGHPVPGLMMAALGGTHPETQEGMGRSTAASAAGGTARDWWERAAAASSGVGRELSLPPSSLNLSAWTFLHLHRPALGCLSSLVFT
ncbi:unnamed protein product [Closterium sp. NIES-64]|nr:unnamed protein product [Closterium sp. NIES-64]